jgi:hypothetical protein
LAKVKIWQVKQIKCKKILLLLDVVHERDLAAVKATIEERMAKLSCVNTEGGSAWRAKRRAIDDLLTWRAEIFAVAHALRLL